MGEAIENCQKYVEDQWKALTRDDIGYWVKSASSLKRRFKFVEHEQVKVNVLDLGRLKSDLNLVQVYVIRKQFKCQVRLCYFRKINRALNVSISCAPKRNTTGR